MSKIIGYTTGVFDLFHIGHLNIIKEAKSKCDYLIVGVTTDEEVFRVKGFQPYIPFNERKEIINSIIYVDKVVSEDSTDKIEAWLEYNFDILFKGSDWENSKEFLKYKSFFNDKNVTVKFFPYTQATSSTKIRKLIEKGMLGD